MSTSPKKEKGQKESIREAEDKELDEALDDTFPASDPPASTAPGHGETGARDIRKERERK
jgi:hypothetical protein